MNDRRVALVVRAGTEIGRKLAQDFASAGLTVALNDLLPGRIEQIAEEITKNGGAASVHSGDLARKLALQTVLQDVLEAYGRIDVLVFVANAQPRDTVLDMDEWDWHAALDQNLTAAFLCAQSVGRVMRETGGGVIAFVLAGDDRVSAAYEAAAAGLRALAEAASSELAEHNIHVLVKESNNVSAVEIISGLPVSTKIN